jgi:hypothetical protein
MHKFDIQKAFGSEKLMICFHSKADDHDFRDCLIQVLSVHGFEFNFEEYHIDIRNNDKESKLNHVAIESDSWFVWGQAAPWKKDIPLNNDLIDWLKIELLRSGKFIEHKNT